ncbi:hypothetical protein AAE478_005081 [Parahypoxylon ruwenzoriense]
MPRKSPEKPESLGKTPPTNPRPTDGASQDDQLLATIRKLDKENCELATTLRDATEDTECLRNDVEFFKATFNDINREISRLGEKGDTPENLKELEACLKRLEELEEALRGSMNDFRDRNLWAENVDFTAEDTSTGTKEPGH